jgi:hypothetical protein
MTPQLKAEGHFVAEQDRERVRCMECSSRAFVCHYVGGGFWYYCGPCAEARGLIEFEPRAA